MKYNFKITFNESRTKCGKEIAYAEMSQGLFNLNEMPNAMIVSCPPPSVNTIGTKYMVLEILKLLKIWRGNAW